MTPGVAPRELSSSLLAWRFVDANELWDAADAKAADAYTMAERATPGVVLMERAALAVASQAQAMLAEAGVGRVIIVCGPGSNGGDGLAVARLLAGRLGGARGVVVHLASPRAHAEQLERARLAGVEVLDDLDAHEVPSLIVDALLGTGASGPLRAGIAEAVAQVRRYAAPVLSIDVPTGVCASTGVVEEGALEATVTVTMQAAKPGLLIGRARQHVGRLVVADIGLDRASSRGPWGRLVVGPDVASTLQQLALQDVPHKGARGHVGVVGGGPTTRGAVVLAAKAALSCGAGLCTVALDDRPARERLMIAEPSLMTTDSGLEPAVGPASVLVVGPGWTQMSSAQARTLWDDPRPALWDAAALRRLAELDAPGAPTPGGPRLLTPHPGEAAALLGETTPGIQGDRGAAARRIAQRYEATVLLKGAGTVLDDGSSRWLCAAGSGALATAGSGDVLAGLCGALLARGLGPLDAARVGAYTHGVAGELAGSSIPGVSASDLIGSVTQALRAILDGAHSDRDPIHVQH